MQRHDQQFLHMGLLSHDNKPHNIHMERDHLHCLFHRQVQIIQDRIDIKRQLEAAGDKDKRIKKVTKLNESKQCMEEGLQDELHML